MLYLFFDYETTGLADFNKRARDPSQPHIVQLAAELTNEVGTVFESHYAIIKPDGWIIPQESIDVHHIDNELAQLVGIPERDAIGMVLSMIKRTPAVQLVSHNLQFEKFISRIAMRRYDLMEDADNDWWKALPGFCTMRETTELCMLPGGRGGQFKWPKLEEAYQVLMRKPLIGAHNAQLDMQATKELFFYLKREQAV